VPSVTVPERQATGHAQRCRFANDRYRRFLAIRHAHTLFQHSVRDFLPWLYVFPQRLTARVAMKNPIQHPISGNRIAQDSSAPARRTKLADAGLLHGAALTFVATSTDAGEK